jgi:hypothetical protein
MAETLLTPTVLKMYGRTIHEMHLVNMRHAKEVADALAAVAAGFSALDPRPNLQAMRAAILHQAQQYTDPDRAYVAHRVLEAISDEALRLPPNASNDVQLKSVQAAIAVATRAYGDTYGTNGNNKFLQHQLQGDEPAQFARIYSFSFEGAYYDLARPSIFLVHGRGRAVVQDDKDGATDLDTSGVMARDWQFSARAGSNRLNDLRYWEYDKGDFTIRLDVETGQLWQVVLDSQNRGADPGAGANASSGMSLTSGMSLNVAGARRR